jgi:hemerythrin-like domain-containing protein
MNNNVSIVLNELRQDHRNMSLMLNLLERESNRLYDDEPVDFDLIHDIMHYMTVYPDAVHHPKEDRIYAEVKAARPDLAAGFDRITVDHRSITSLSLTLRNEVDAVRSGTIVQKKQVVADLQRYVNSLRSHMQWEELDLFRRVEEMARDGHKLIEAATVLQSADPVFGPEVEENFGRLFSTVQERLRDEA